MLSFSSCTKNVTQGGVSITLEAATVEVSMDGGEATVTYKVSGDFDKSLFEPSPAATWVNRFDVSEDGVIRFNVEPSYIYEPRETLVEIYYDGYATNQSFTVKQQAYDGRVREIDFHNKVWDARICEFDREGTLFYHMIKDADGRYDFDYDPSQKDYIRHITAGEFADKFVEDYNADHPDSPITDKDVLNFEFDDTHFFEMAFKKDKYLVTYDGIVSPAGTVAVRKVRGKWEFDSETSVLSVLHTGNTVFPPQTIKIHVTKDDEGNLSFEFIEIDNYYLEAAIPGDMFSFTLLDYPQENVYQPADNLVYHCEEIPLSRYEDYDYHDNEPEEI